MNLDFNIGARRAKAIRLDGDDRVAAVAGGGVTERMCDASCGLQTRRAVRNLPTRRGLRRNLRRE
jgi:hypothetical protein